MFGGSIHIEIKQTIVEELEMTNREKMNIELFLKKQKEQSDRNIKLIRSTTSMISNSKIRPDSKDLLMNMIADLSKKQDELDEEFSVLEQRNK